MSDFATVRPRFPEISYRDHPGYCRRRGLDGFVDRIRALNMLRHGYFAAIGEYLRARRTRHRSCRNNQGWDDYTPGKTAHQLEADGAVVYALSSSALQRVQAALRNCLGIDELEGIELDSNNFYQHKFRKESTKEIFDALDAALREVGALDDARHYLGSGPLSLQGARLVINGYDPTFRSGLFAENGVPDPVTRYFHIDSAPRYAEIKFLLYLSGVNDDEDGPNCYVSGSHRCHEGFLGQLTRRAVHRSLVLRGWSEEGKRLFASLPEALQKKAEFGSDILGDPELARDLLEHERRVYGPPGTLILFDANGIHRGRLMGPGRKRLSIHGFIRYDPAAQ